LALSGAPAAIAADTPVDAYWQAQRLELTGRSDEALKRYDRLIAKVPTSAVAADRLLATALLQGDMKAALKALRTQQLADLADASSPLLFAVEGWKRGDWNAVDSAIRDLKDRESFAFMVPLLNGWKNVSQGKDSGITTAVLRADPMLGYYSADQLIYMDLARNNLGSAKERLTRFDGFSENYGRHVALTAVRQLSANGDAEFSKSLLLHVGGQPGASLVGNPKLPPKQIAELGIAAHFARLSDQLHSQSAEEQALYFARLAHWMAPWSEVGKLTLSERLDEAGRSKAADLLVADIAPQSLHGSWAVRQSAMMLNARGEKKAALALVKLAKTKVSSPDELSLLEAQLNDDAGDYPAAIAIYRSVIASADQRAESARQRAVYRILLGQMLEKTNDWPSARKELEAALLIDGQNPQLLNYLGYSLLERRDNIKRGFALVTKAHQLSPTSPEITDSLGWGYFLSGEYAQAVPLLEQAVGKAIGDVTINEHLGDAYWKSGRKIEARYAWRAASLLAKDDSAKRIASKIDLGLNENNASP
jgi:tetratricopeptide (TPR) repeat protein